MHVVRVDSPCQVTMRSWERGWGGVSHLRGDLHGGDAVGVVDRVGHAADGDRAARLRHQLAGVVKRERRGLLAGPGGGGVAAVRRAEEAALRDAPEIAPGPRQRRA